MDQFWYSLKIQGYPHHQLELPYILKLQFKPKNKTRKTKSLSPWQPEKTANILQCHHLIVHKMTSSIEIPYC